MIVRVLGSSGGRIPGRALTSFLVNGDTLLDVGGASGALDERAQSKIKRVLISHSHLDHIYSLAFILETALSHHKSVEIISAKKVLDIIAGDFLNNRLWPDFTKIKTKENKPIAILKPLLPGRKKRIEKYTVEAIEVNHPVPAVGFIISDEEGTLFYTGDMGPTPAVWKRIKTSRKKIDALLTELSFPNKMEALALLSGHLTPDMLEDGMLEAGIVDIPVYLSHIKPAYLKTIIEELDKLPRKNIHVLKDGSCFRVKSKTLHVEA